MVLFFHFAFRTAALVFYIVCGWMNNTFVTQSVLLLVLLALDFWFVKNVSGRILAGLRWWSAVDDGGNAFWVFESANREASSSVGAIQMPVSTRPTLHSSFEVRRMNHWQMSVLWSAAHLRFNFLDLALPCLIGSSTIGRNIEQ